MYCPRGRFVFTSSTTQKQTVIHNRSNHHEYIHAALHIYSHTSVSVNVSRATLKPRLLNWCVCALLKERGDPQQLITSTLTVHICSMSEAPALNVKITATSLFVSWEFVLHPSIVLNPFKIQKNWCPVCNDMRCSHEKQRVWRASLQINYTVYPLYMKN